MRIKGLFVFIFLAFTTLANASDEPIIATRTLPHSGDVITYELINRVEQNQKNCESVFSLIVTANLNSSGILAVTSHISQTSGVAGCGSPSKAIRTWHYVNATRELIRMTECKTENLSTCVDRTPLPTDQWQSPQHMGECSFVGIEIISVPYKEVAAEHFSCNLSASLTTGQSNSEIWTNETVYEPYPVIRLENQILLPEFTFKMKVSQQLISVIAN